MSIPFPLKLALFGLFALIAVSTATAFAAGITVSSSNVDEKSILVTANDLKPSACAGLSLTKVLNGSGTLTDTNGNELIIGSSDADTIDGFAGDDCILGGSGDDSLTGNGGNAVCIGGPGNDIFTDCAVEIQ